MVFNIDSNKKWNKKIPKDHVTLKTREMADEKSALLSQE